MRKLLATLLLAGVFGCSQEAAQNRSNSGKPQGDRAPNVGSPDAQTPGPGASTPGTSGSGGKGGTP